MQRDGGLLMGCCHSWKARADSKSARANVRYRRYSAGGLINAMALRWTAAGMMEAAKGFRRLKAYKQLPIFRAALVAYAAKKQHVTSKIDRKRRPHSMVNANACFAYFNKIWGISFATSSRLSEQGRGFHDNPTHCLSSQL